MATTQRVLLGIAASVAVCLAVLFGPSAGDAPSPQGPSLPEGRDQGSLLARGGGQALPPGAGDGACERTRDRRAVLQDASTGAILASRRVVVVDARRETRIARLTDAAGSIELPEGPVTIAPDVAVDGEWFDAVTIADGEARQVALACYGWIDLECAAPGVGALPVLAFSLDGLGDRLDAWLANNSDDDSLPTLLQEVGGTPGNAPGQLRWRTGRPFVVACLAEGQVGVEPGHPAWVGATVPLPNGGARVRLGDRDTTRVPLSEPLSVEAAARRRILVTKAPAATVEFSFDALDRPTDVSLVLTRRCALGSGVGGSVWRIAARWSGRAVPGESVRIEGCSHGVHELNGLVRDGDRLVFVHSVFTLDQPVRFVSQAACIGSHRLLVAHRTPFDGHRPLHLHVVGDVIESCAGRTRPVFVAEGDFPSTFTVEGLPTAVGLIQSGRPGGNEEGPLREWRSAETIWLP